MQWPLHRILVDDTPQLHQVGSRDRHTQSPTLHYGRSLVAPPLCCYRPPAAQGRQGQCLEENICMALSYSAHQATPLTILLSTLWIPQPIPSQIVPTQPRPLTITDHHGVLPMVAVVDPPAREAALAEACLIPLTRHIVHPDRPRSTHGKPAGTSSDGIIETKHPGMEQRQRLE